MMINGFIMVSLVCFFVTLFHSPACLYYSYGRIQQKQLCASAIVDYQFFPKTHEAYQTLGGTTLQAPFFIKTEGQFLKVKGSFHCILRNLLEVGVPRLLRSWFFSTMGNTQQERSQRGGLFDEKSLCAIIQRFISKIVNGFPLRAFAGHVPESYLKGKLFIQMAFIFWVHFHLRQSNF